MDDAAGQEKRDDPAGVIRSINSLYTLGQVELVQALDMLFLECARVGPFVVVDHADKELVREMLAVVIALLEDRTDDATRSWKEVAEPKIQAGIRRFADAYQAYQREKATRP